MTPRNLNYVKQLQISFVLVLLLLVLLFWMFPQFKRLPRTLPAVKIQNIKVVQIPRTVQKRRAAPPPAKPVIPVAGEEIDILEEIPIEAADQVTVQSPFNGDLPLTEDALPYMPRQIVEALPRVDDLKLKGRVVMKLLIDKNGNVKQSRVLLNSTGNPLVVQRVLEAIHKSRWEVIQLNENRVEYWITKVYQFK